MPAVLARVRAAGYSGHLTLITTVPVLLPAGSPYWMESVEYAGPPALTAGDVAALGGAGVVVDAWTPETAAQFGEIPVGVSQVTTDNVTGFLAWCGR